MNAFMSVLFFVNGVVVFCIYATQSNPQAKHELFLMAVVCLLIGKVFDLQSQVDELKKAAK